MSLYMDAVDGTDSTHEWIGVTNQEWMSIASVSDDTAGPVGDGEALSCPPMPGPAIGPWSSSHKPPMRPVPRSRHTLGCNSQECDGSWGDWGAGSCTRSRASSWVDAAPLAPLPLPDEPTGPLGLCTSGKCIDDISAGTLAVSRPLGAASFFSAWLKGECQVVAPAVDLERSEELLAGQPTAACLSVAHLEPNVRLEGPAVGCDFNSSQLVPSALQGAAAPSSGTEVSVEPESGSADGASSLSSPVGSDCRAEAADECSSDKSGLSHSISLSWDVQSSCSSISVSSSGSDSGPGDAHQQLQEEGCGDPSACWAAVVSGGTPDEEVSPRGCSPVYPRTAGRTPCSYDYTQLRMVECDVWEREVEARVAASSRRCSGADAAMCAEPPLAHLVWLVVTETLFEPPPCGEACSCDSLFSGLGQARFPGELLPAGF